MANQPDSKFFFMNLKRQVSKNGKTYYSGKYAYAIDMVGFEKADGSGDLTLWLSPKDMDKMKQESQPRPRPPAPRPQPPRPPQPPVAAQRGYVDHTQPPQMEDGDPGYDSEIPF